MLLGSHCDSVRRGGRYDGAYGVLAALEVVRTLNDHGLTTGRPLEIVNWTNEEGVRFEPAMTSSGAIAGRFSRAYVYDRTDRDGHRFEDELRRIGYLGRESDRPGPAAAYLELHIEQGPVLEEAGLPVGVVEGIVGITWSEVTIVGRSDHAGPSPMVLRHDALAAAARVISAAEALARETPNAMATVGRLAVEPNVINTIPGRVVMSVDFRHRDPATLDALVAALERELAAIAEERGVTFTLDRFWTSEPTPFDHEVVGAIQAACDDLRQPSLHLWSGAGHDAKYLAEVCPTAMIFVRSDRRVEPLRGGVQHAGGPGGGRERAPARRISPGRERRGVEPIDLRSALAGGEGGWYTLCGIGTAPHLEGTRCPASPRWDHRPASHRVPAASESGRDERRCNLPATATRPTAPGRTAPASRSAARRS